MKALLGWIALALLLSACGGGNEFVGDLRDGGMVLNLEAQAGETTGDYTLVACFVARSVCSPVY